MADRRSFLGGLACASACASAAFAAGSVGLVETSVGEANAQIRGATRPLTAGADIFVGDLVSTSATARLVMLLGSATRVRLGSNTRLRVDKFLANAGGELTFDSGPVVVDHDEKAGPIDLRLRSPFGLIAVRGTRFFAGPSNGTFGVFVERGIVDFTAGGVTLRLTAGEGTDVKRPGDKPSAMRRWPFERANDAMLSTY
ncbi:FecR family protein [Methylocella silvestris]|uniref:FecR family protein n=1 Tax=Methylocella silvestris TaxID=199596 RepID=UPI0002F8AF39|nr:FecR family protein [Methylocella silvestris]